MRKDLSIQEIKELAVMISNLPDTTNDEILFQPSPSLSKLLNAEVTFSKRNESVKIMVNKTWVYKNADILYVMYNYNATLTFVLLSIQKELFQQSSSNEWKFNLELTRLLGLDYNHNGGKSEKVYVRMIDSNLQFMMKNEEYNIEQFLSFFMAVKID